jgi:hypothetical protein
MGVYLMGVHFTGVYAYLIAEVINTEVACGCNLPAEVACPETFCYVPISCAGNGDLLASSSKIKVITTRFLYLALKCM